MSRPLKDPKAKTEKTVNQMIGKFRILRNIADGGHLTVQQSSRIVAAINNESVKLVEAVKGYEKQPERKPFKL